MGQRGYHWRMDKKDMAKYHAAKCKDRYARAVGTMAYLKTRLALKSDQTAAFERWQSAVLAQAKKGADRCAAMTPPAKRPSLVEGMKHHEMMLEHRLESVKAQMPAFESLAAKLDDTQQRILARGLHKMMRGDRGWRGHRGFGHHDRWGRGRMMGPMMGPGRGPGPQGPAPDGN
jgi:hypothetical protein